MLLTQTSAPPESSKFERFPVVGTVRAVLDRPDHELDYARAKIAFDRLIDPSVDEKWVLAELDRLSMIAQGFAGASPDNAAKLNTVRRTIYEGGPWNGWRSFGYDHSNVRGQDVRLKLLSHYLKTRRGDCLSMPVLFLILAERLGLDVALSLAPNHLFVKLRLSDGRSINLEPTSGGNPARDEWLRRVRPMTERSIESGMYLRPLSKREGIASMAGGVVQFLRDKRQFEETAAVCELILEHSPRDGLVLVNLAVAYRNLFEKLVRQYPHELTIPLGVRLDCCTLLRLHRSAAARARALGWEDIAARSNKEKSNA